MAGPVENHAVALRSVTKRYGDAVAVHQVSLHVERNRTLAILGPSGCGKTTILRMIAGFVEPDEGSVEIAGAPMHKIRAYERNVGLVFQDYALFPHMTVEQNIRYPLRWRDPNGPGGSARVEELLRLVRLSGFEKRRPSELSGGQQQRVALARALASRPELLLLDEPLSALDARLRLNLRMELKEILKSVGVSCIVVTHDQEEAMSLADDLIVMNRGSIEQRGGPYELYNHPRSRFVAEFIGRSNFFDGVVTEGPAGEGTFETTDGFRIRLADRTTALGNATICIRPERLTIGSAADPGLNILSGRVADIVEFGTERQISVALASGRWVHVVEKDHRAVLPVNGAGCELSFRSDACIVIPADAEK